MMRIFPTHSWRAVAGVAFFAVTVSSAQAGVIIGGSSILEPTSLNQLEDWLGEGPLTLTNEFTKDSTDTSKDDSADWHAAVDGKGRTFSLWEVMTSDGAGGLDTFIFGGYNPQSWSSNGGWNNTINDADRTAFLFNLTTNTKLSQCKATDNSLCGSDNNNNTGHYQTYNRLSYGPTFGAGHDLWVNSTLSGGANHAYSYGNPAGDPGETYASPLDNDDTSNQWHSVGALETFSIAPYTGTVPEPGILALFGFGLAGLGFSKRMKGRVAARS